MKIIGVSGAKRSGKDTLGQVLIDEFGFARVSFAQPLKEMLATLYQYVGYSDEEINERINGDLKESPDKNLFDKSGRFLMVTLGTEWARDSVHKDFWVGIARARIQSLKRAGVKGVVFTDVRFPNELDMIRALGGTTLVVRRKEVEPSMRWYARLWRWIKGHPLHPSETLWHTGKFDAQIDNNGTKEAFEAYAWAWANKETCK